MSNKDRADMTPEQARGILSLLDDHTVIGQADAQWAVETISNAGFLMPDLPEPDDASIFVPDGAGWQTPQDSTVWTAIGGRVMIQRVEPGNFTPSEARSLAYALLAAAKHAEEQE